MISIVHSGQSILNVLDILSRVGVTMLKVADTPPAPVKPTPKMDHTDPCQPPVQR